MSNIIVNTITPLAGVTGTVNVSGSLMVSGSITAHGNIILGNESGDSLSIGAEISSSIIPDADVNYNLGSLAKRWTNIHASTGSFNNISGSILFQNDISVQSINATGNITASGDISSSGTITSNVMTPTTITNVNTTHVTASGQISASGNLYAARVYPNGPGGPYIDESQSGNNIGSSTGLFASTHITSSGNISASGHIYGDRGEFSTVLIDGETALDTSDSATKGMVFADSQITKIDIGKANAVDDLTLHARNTHMMGNVTASGNISASGTIYASKFESAGASGETISFNDNLNITGHITASGNISSSGIITAEGLSISDDATITDDLEVGGDGIVKGNLQLANVGLASPPALLYVAGNISSTSHITASGHISTSNNMYAARIFVDNTNYIDVDTAGSTFFNKSLKTTANITASGDISSSGVITGNSLVGTLGTAAQANITSVGTLTSLTSTGDSILGNATTDTHLCTGNITSSGNISSSGHIIAHNFEAINDISALGNISSSATVFGEHLYSSDDAEIVDTLTVGTIVNVNTTHVTASGQISGSGGLFGPHTLITVSQPNVTTLAGTTSIGTSGATTRFLGDIDVDEAAVFDSTITAAGNIMTETNFHAVGHVTASGDISGSGALIIEKTATFHSIVSATGGAVTLKKKMLNIVAQTSATQLTVGDSGTTIMLGGGAGTQAGQIQVINLPTVQAADVGTYFDFRVGVSGNSGAEGSFTINTGGHASNLTPAQAATLGYDDFFGVLHVVDTTGVIANDRSIITPADGEGAMILALDTTSGGIAVGSSFRCMAVNPSTTTEDTNVWWLSGTLLSADATGFVTTNVFTDI